MEFNRARKLEKPVKVIDNNGWTWIIRLEFDNYDSHCVAKISTEQETELGLFYAIEVEKLDPPIMTRKVANAWKKKSEQAEEINRNGFIANL